MRVSSKPRLIYHLNDHKHECLEPTRIKSADAEFKKTSTKS